MSGADPLTISLLQILILVVPSAALALLLRATGAPGGARGAAICAGVFVGLLAGPGAFGAKWPRWHEEIFVGGVEERIALERTASRHREEIVALGEIGVSQTAIEEKRREHGAEIAPLARKLDEARGAHRSRFDLLAHLILGLLGAALAPSLVPASRGLLATLARTSARLRLRPELAGLLGLVLSGAAPAVAFALAAPAGLGASLGAGLLFGASGMALTVPRRIVLAGATSATLSVLALIALAPTPGLAIAGVGLALGALAPLALARPAVRRIRDAGRLVAWAVALPGASAFLAVRFDPAALASNHTREFWSALIIAILWSSDGRWLADWMALRSTGVMHRTWTLSALWVNSGADIVMVAGALVLASAGVASEPLAFGAMIGAALVSLTGGARLIVARVLEGQALNETGR